MQEDLLVKPGLTIPAHELDLSVSRSGGPGGQHVNKTSTKVSLSWDVSSSRALNDEQRALVMTKLAHRITQEGHLQVHVDESRSQLRNRELALARLAGLLLEALHQPKARKKTRPTRASAQRRVEHKKQRAQVKQARKRPTRQDW